MNTKQKLNTSEARAEQAASKKYQSIKLGMAERVYSCYEAGPGGFVLHRQLTELGVTDYVVAPRSLDPDHKRVQNDSTDARQLALDLDRYVGGNLKALRIVYVPS